MHLIEDSPHQTPGHFDSTANSISIMGVHLCGLYHLPSQLPGPHKTVLFFVDLLTKMSHFMPGTHISTAEVIAQLFFNHVFKLPGLPSNITSDQGLQLISHFWATTMIFIPTRFPLPVPPTHATKSPMYPEPSI